MNTRSLRFPSAVVVLAGFAASAHGQAIGNDFQVNTFTTGAQLGPAIASDAAGNFVVVWQSDGQDGDGGGIFGQRYDAWARRLGAEFQVNADTAGAQQRPRVAAAAGGAFVVVWESVGPGGFANAVVARHYAADGTPSGPDFVVSTAAAGQSQPAVAAAPDGRFVVVWTNDAQDGDGNGVFGRRFNGKGTPLGGEFQINTYTTNDQDSPDVVMAPDASFVVVWHSVGQDGSGSDLFGRRFDPGGSPLGAEFAAMSSSVSNEAFVQPSLAMNAAGEFVVVSERATGYYGWILGQQFDSGGTPAGPAFFASCTFQCDREHQGAVASDLRGNFVVAWRHDDYGNGVLDIGIQRFDATGQSSGSMLRANTYAPGTNGRPRLAAVPNGDFIVVWEGLGQDGSDSGIFGRRFRGTQKGDFGVRTNPDFAADYKTDILFRHQVSGRNLIWFMNGTSLIEGWFTGPDTVGDPNWRIVGTADFDSDLRTDILWRNAASGRNVVWLMQGPYLASATSAVFTNPDRLADTNWRMVATADFNSDGQADILWRHAVSGKNVGWLMDGITRTSGAFTNPDQLPDALWTIAGAADFSGDGGSDILWRHQASGKIAVWLMDGLTRMAGVYTTPSALADTKWQIAGVGDYDGDSKPDVLWRNFASGKIAVWIMDGITRTAGVYTNPDALADTNWKIVGPR